MLERILRCHWVRLKDSNCINTVASVIRHRKTCQVCLKLYQFRLKFKERTVCKLVQVEAAHDPATR